jgi:outer membrane lipoprotein SlyB
MRSLPAIGDATDTACFKPYAMQLVLPRALAFNGSIIFEMSKHLMPLTGDSMKKNRLTAAAALIAAISLAGCASPSFYPSSASQTYPAASQPYPVGQQTYPVSTQSYPAAAQGYSSAYGVVDSIQVSRASSNGGSGMGMGAVVGGAVGGLLGNQVGGGRGKTAATIAGAIGGAMVGNQVEQRNTVQLRDQYQIGVRMDNGDYRTIVQDSVADLQVGSRVRVENDRAYRF